MPAYFVTLPAGRKVQADNTVTDTQVRFWIAMRTFPHATGQDRF